MSATPFDFRRPPPGVLEQQTQSWLAAASRLSVKAWPRLLPFAAAFAPSATFVLAEASIDEPLVTFSLTTAAAADGTAILGLPRPLLLLLLTGLLGETPKRLPEDRDLTEIEASVVGFLVRELFLGLFESAWLGSAPIAINTGPMLMLRSNPQSVGADMTIHSSLEVSTPFGPQMVHLLLPRCGVWEELLRVARVSTRVSLNPEQMVALVREMPVELSVILGTANLTMSEMAALRDGDIVVFRQKVDEPLDACVSGSKKYHVWPGAIGNRIAFQIDSLESA